MVSPSLLPVVACVFLGACSTGGDDAYAPGFIGAGAGAHVGGSPKGTGGANVGENEMGTGSVGGGGNPMGIGGEQGTLGDDFEHQWAALQSSVRNAPAGDDSDYCEGHLVTLLWNEVRAEGGNSNGRWFGPTSDQFDLVDVVEHFPSYSAPVRLRLQAHQSLELELEHPTALGQYGSIKGRALTEGRPFFATSPESEEQTICFEGYLKRHPLDAEGSHRCSLFVATRVGYEIGSACAFEEGLTVGGAFWDVPS